MNFINKIFGNQFVDKIFCNLPIAYWAKSIKPDGMVMDLGSIIPYGGYMEDRKESMQDTYLKEKDEFVHLGVDFWVPAGTEVFVPNDQNHVNFYSDKDNDGGWGGVVLTETNGHYFLYAHLDIYDKRIVGREDVNGGWYPHLHIQAIDKKELKLTNVCLKDLLQDIDGYAKRADIDLIKLFPDPIPLL